MHVDTYIYAGGKFVCTNPRTLVFADTFPKYLSGIERVRTPLHSVSPCSMLPQNKSSCPVLFCVMDVSTTCWLAECNRRAGKAGLCIRCCQEAAAGQTA